MAPASNFADSNSADSNSAASIDKQQLIDCHDRIRPFIHRTPVMSSRLLNEKSGAQLFFKCENFQRMGAFKMRGAAHALLCLSDDEKSKGVVTHSSGNFAQALALAATTLGIKSFIVMPENAPQVKKNAVKDYGGQVIECESTLAGREATAEQVGKEHGARFVHPYNDLDVVLGQGTAGKELLEDHPDLEFLLAPVGGGGLVSGCAIAAHFWGNNCQTIGGEPFAVDDAYRAFESGKLERNETTETIADGLRTQLGDVTLPLIRKYVQRIVRVEEQEIIDAMRLIWERMKIVIEPSCAVPLAAVLREKEAFAGRRVGIVLSGGNVDVGALPF